MLVKMYHAKALNYCSNGVKHWCKQNGINYIKFIKIGIEEDIILAVGDGMARRVVETAREMEKNK
ncbi:MAG: hypothetical protein ABUK08_00085 [Candidatus Humimicrobiaceae bacterium]